MPRYQHYDATDAFMRRLRELPDTEEVQLSVNAVIDQIMQDPERCRPNARGIRVAKLPSHRLADDRLCPGLRVAYTAILNRGVQFDHAARRLVILHDIELYDETTDLRATDPLPTASKTNRSH
jgi:hypothetical protein